MYPVAVNFHTSVENNAPTRVRIYLFGPSVDPTDDNDVQTNGTLLKMNDSDTDSNGRIEQPGIEFTEMFDREKNILIGDTVSSQMTFTLINTDGAFSGYNFQRYKVYLDVWYATGNTWLPCPMGAYIFQTPEQTFGNLIRLTAFDTMQDLNAIADSWFNGLSWSAGITLEDLFIGIATQCGKSYKSDAAMVNKTVTFTEAPFVSSGRTFRDILAWVAEASCSIAKFDRDGYLVLRWFDEAQISGSTYTKNVDQIGCGVFSIEVGEYTVAAVTGMTVNALNQDNPVVVGTSGSIYIISGNPFLNDTLSADIATKATPILAKLSGLGAFTPISMSTITDWSIEAGDIINVLYKTTTYRLPIFQQKMVWRGQYVKSDLYSSGNKAMPDAESEQDRDSYRTEKELYGKVTFLDLYTPGATVINGGNITTGYIEADRIKGGELTIGGDANANGTITILDNSDWSNGTIDNKGYEIKGKIVRSSSLGTTYRNTIRTAYSGKTVAFYDTPEGGTESLVLSAGPNGEMGPYTHGRISVQAGHSRIASITIEADPSTTEQKVQNGTGYVSETVTSAGVASVVVQSATNPAKRIKLNPSVGSEFQGSVYFYEGINVTGNIKIGSTTLNETQLQQLLALI